MKVVGLGLLKHLEWPEGRPSPSAVRDASFNLGHVLFIKVGRPPLQQVPGGYKVAVL